MYSFPAVELSRPRFADPDLLCESAARADNLGVTLRHYALDPLALEERGRSELIRQARELAELIRVVIA